LYGSDPVIQYKRKRVREHVTRFLKPSSTILELNCGTGEDALYFASRGHAVHATDFSEGMLSELQCKLGQTHLSRKISMEQCSFTHLEELGNQGPFDAIFSNFGGLNCTGELHKVLQSFSPLLKPGGTVSLVIISRFCLWELLLVFKGKFKTAFRRFFSRTGRRARVEGMQFKCWYYHPSYVLRHLRSDFECLHIEGLCTLVPPSYLEGFNGKYPRLFSLLKTKEEQLKSSWPWRSMGDYFIITLRRKN
jgi:ubiquinone/menaquinone biosynthesis C-methylase UbiE